MSILPSSCGLPSHTGGNLSSTTPRVGRLIPASKEVFSATRLGSTPPTGFSHTGTGQWVAVFLELSCAHRTSVWNSAAEAVAFCSSDKLPGHAEAVFHLPQFK